MDICPFTQILKVDICPFTQILKVDICPFTQILKVDICPFTQILKVDICPFTPFLKVDICPFTPFLKVDICPFSMSYVLIKKVHVKVKMRSCDVDVFRVFLKTSSIPVSNLCRKNIYIRQYNVIWVNLIWTSRMMVRCTKSLQPIAQCLPATADAGDIKRRPNSDKHFYSVFVNMPAIFFQTRSIHNLIKHL
ncbi:hypothetical protein DPMN_037016 [Dreissena polymorpha]|uniref:Uncharacterized protein n=1 Tax=Dreissena polymorpha TaxID=45954 RepID=A0A9D4ME56_DREPO|nr:hypothetical protein DPMN_037016 [Dreissena polymorpha]